MAVPAARTLTGPTRPVDPILGLAGQLAPPARSPLGLAAVRSTQSVVVASHGRFLRAPEPALTARQEEVLRLLAEGLTVHAIGSLLGISQSTLDKHVRDLYGRLATQDRASTIRPAGLRGLLDGLVGEDWQDLLIVAPA